MTPPIRVVIADDHEVVRVGLETLLGSVAPHIEVVGHAGSVLEMTQTTRKRRPDVLLADVQMDENALDALDMLRGEFPSLGIVVLTHFDNPTYIARALIYKVNAYLFKGVSGPELVQAIEAAARGEQWFHVPEVARIRQLLLATRKKPEDADIPLSHREMQVLRHVALGLSNMDIARSLNITVDTVKEHVQSILRKLQVSDRTQAAVWAIRRGVI